MIRFHIICLFPEMFKGVLNTSMLEKAARVGATEFNLINLRDFGQGPRRQVDDKPYGGGDGMLLMVEPLVLAIDQARQLSPNSLVVLPSPRGELFKQQTALELSQAARDLIILCPRYEGYDERLVNFVDKVYRIGDYVLTGGELPAMVIIDAVTRLLPGVLGGTSSALKESFVGSDELVEHPQYTRPEEFRGLKVPAVLLGGHHGKVDDWRTKHSQPKQT